MASWLVEPKEKRSYRSLVFYLTMTEKSSVAFSPLNTPVHFLKSSFISGLNLPFHEEDSSEKSAIAECYKYSVQKEDIGFLFIKNVENRVLSLLKEINPDRVAIAGLSRGAFFGCYLFSLLKNIGFEKIPLLMYSPLVKMVPYNPSFSDSEEPSLLLEILKTQKCGPFFISVGHKDERVGTKRVLSFTEALFKEVQEETSSRFLMFPSIGYLGHGTSLSVFEEGAQWLNQQIH